MPLRSSSSVSSLVAAIITANASGGRAAGHPQRRGSNLVVRRTSAIEGDPDVGAAALAVDSTRSAAVRQRDRLHDREAEAAAAASAALVCTAEAIECACGELRREALSLVGDVQLDVPVHGPCRQLDGAAAVRERV